jgi:broad specificity phosphatase PhoE
MNRQIVLIRHGATEHNDHTDDSQDRIRGHNDIPLNEQGIAEAINAAPQVRADVLVSSDLQRASQTAAIISKLTSIPLVEVSPMFRPWDVGEFTGQLSKTACPVMIKYAETKPAVNLPGGESFNDFKHRFFAGLDRALDKYPGVIGVVAHHRNDMLLKGWQKLGYPEDGSIDIRTFDNKGDPPGSVIPFMIPADKLKAAAQRQARGLLDQHAFGDGREELLNPARILSSLQR